MCNSDCKTCRLVRNDYYTDCCLQIRLSPEGLSPKLGKSDLERSQVRLDSSCEIFRKMSKTSHFQDQVEAPTGQCFKIWLKAL